MTLQERDTPLVARLAGARRTRTGIRVDDPPAEFSQAYPVSAGVCAALGERVGGWKVGLLPSGAGIAAPMYASGFLKSGGAFRLAAGRAMIPEVEIAVRLKRDLAPQKGGRVSREDILDAASELLLGFELIERRVDDNSGLNPLNLADDLGNIGYVTGPAVQDFRRLDFANLHCRFWMGSELVTDRRGGHANGDPLAPMIAWANCVCDELGGMKAGQIVTLGSLTPMRIVEGPMLLAAELEGFGRITVDIEGAAS